jgi:quercetin 2,3-dioxygenase
MKNFKVFMLGAVVWYGGALSSQNELQKKQEPMDSIVLHRAETRGSADHGWLKAKHTFSFAGYMDPQRIHFGALRVLNDDIVAGGRGFGTHPHDNMEIITIPLKGALEHKDNTGGHGVIRSGDVQVMSAGTGVFHSEYNHSATEEVNLLQIWVFPAVKGVKPRYDQRFFDSQDRKNKFQLLVGPMGSSSLEIHQDAWFSRIDLDASKTISYPLYKPNSGLYVFVIEGNLFANQMRLESRDGAGFSTLENGTLELKAETDSKILLMEVPMRW